MRRPFRAPALAAAAFSFFAFTSFVEPTIASEAPATPGISYTAHAAVAVQSLDLGTNSTDEAEQPALEADGAAPIVTHAFAPALPAEEEDEEAEEASPPDERNGRTLAQLVADYSGTETPDEETECLARAVYYESKGEPLAGQLTVAEVIINRAESGRFASTLCGVVRQRGQFSFVRGGVIPVPPRASRDWRTAVAIAQIANRDLADGAASGALFFHARHVSPGWRRTRVATVGNHVFYR
jgi:spore germination cell wall hydrolase CwlJ-like protein